ncbi:MAG: DUF480 domain-containing protein [Planctomycetota bacterium]|nr:DUF480 domain-containing protein [Planctomycetota bacterium]
MDVKLNDIDRRVLGVLMEKEMSQPDYYPMTLSAVVAACNQKQNRDPVMSLDEVAIEAALGFLQEMGLLTAMFPSQGGRAKRHRHEAEKVFGWQKAERAVMSELLLRGPQTVGELRTRCQRFVRFADLAVVSQVLDELNRRDPPMAQAMPRELGRTAIRYQHLLGSEDPLPTSSTPVARATVEPEVAQTGDPLAVMQTELSALRRELDDVQKRLFALESR